MKENGKILPKSGVIKTGERGVLLVTEALLSRGFNPYKPVVDDHGVDLMLLNGVRIQVKAANLSHNRTRDASCTYAFSCEQNTGKRALTSKRRIFANYCDFVVLVGLNQRRFWVIPASIVDAYAGKAIIMTEKDDAPTLLRINEMIEKGMPKVEIARELGCCETTIWKRKRGFRERNSKARVLRSYEDRWDLLVDPAADDPHPNIPTIYERDVDFVATLAGPIAA